jgi:chemotaxis protein MotA
MDLATVFGIIIAGGGILWAMFETTHGNMACFFSIEGVVVVVLGSFAAACMAMPMRTVLDVFGILKKWLFGKDIEVNQLITCLVDYAEVARRDGMLALEEVLKTQEDPFLQKGLQLAIDGTDPEIIEETLQIEMESQEQRHKKGKQFFSVMGAYGPGFGLTATVIGQIAMFQNLGGDTAAIGRTLGMALVATLYGCIIQNAVCGPIANKLGIRSAEETFVKEMALVGIMSIQSGDNPHVVEIKLHSFLSDRQRNLLEKRK